MNDEPQPTIMGIPISNAPNFSDEPPLTIVAIDPSQLFNQDGTPWSPFAGPTDE